MVTVKAWYNTGFNKENRPASPNGAWTSECYSKDFPALDILQHVGLASIKIKATLPDVVDIDYIRLDPPYSAGERQNHGNNMAFSYAYYLVTGYRMLNGDTALLTLVPDNLTTAGGWGALKILDGITRRLTIKKSDDVFGRYTQEDNYLVPDRPLVIETETVDPTGDNDYITYVESTIDLGVMGNVAEGIEYDTIDPASTYNVTVPKSYPNFHSPTKYELDSTAMIPGRGNRSVIYPMDTFQNLTYIPRGIEMIRSLGIEGVLLQTAMISARMVTPYFANEEMYKTDPSGTVVVGPNENYLEWTDTDAQGQTVTENAIIGPEMYEWQTGEQSRFWVVCSDMVGSWQVEALSNIDLEYSQTVENKRVLYGELNRIGILTNAGNKLEVKPEAITGGQSLEVVCVSDPHLNGAPYWRFRYMNGQDGATPGQEFFQNAVKGMPWKSVPLIFTEKSGSLLDSQNFYDEQSVKRTAYDLQSKAYDEAQQAQGWIKGAIAGVGAAATVGAGAGAGAIGSIGGALGLTGAETGATMATGGVLSAFTGLGPINATQELQAQQYYTGQQTAQRQFLTAQNVVAPSINFPYNNEGYRDFFGESAVVYRYRPTDADLAKMDKILSMYGYATTQPVTTDIINNRQKFVYIEANITVGNDLPQWLADAVAQEISNGVRLWKVKPDTQYYERGGNPDVV